MLLAGDPNRAADETLLAVLPQAKDAALQARLLGTLVARGHAAALATVVARFHDYDATLQQLILSHVNELFTGVRIAAGAAAFESRSAAMAIINRSDDARNAYLLADALRHPCARTRECAAGALHDMVARLVDRRAAGVAATDLPGLQQQTRHLVEAARGALSCWEVHLQPKALLAALWLIDWTEPDLQAKLAEPRTRIVHALETLLRRTPDARLAGFALRALAIPQVRTAAADAVAHAQDPALLRALLAQTWLLADAEIGRRCRWVRALPGLQQHWDGICTAAGETGPRAVRLLAASGVDREHKFALYRRGLQAEQPALARAVTWALVEDEHEATHELLALAGNHRDPGAARTATRELRRRRARRVLQSPAGGTAARSTAIPAETDLMATSGPVARRGPSASGGPAQATWWEQVWGRFDRLGPAEQATLRETLKAQRGPLLVRVRAKLADGDSATRLRGLQLARTLGLVSELAEQLYRLAHDANATVRSHAVGLLTELPGPTTLRILRDLLHDPDERVQANAIDALDALELTERVPQLEEKLSSPHNRVRANAIQALLRLQVSEAGSALLDMLEHASSAHRLSALWVVERLQLRTLLGRLETLAYGDPDVKVRRRAERILHGLTAGPGAPTPVVAGSKAAPTGRPRSPSREAPA